MTKDAHQDLSNAISAAVEAARDAPIRVRVTDRYPGAERRAAPEPKTLSLPSSSTFVELASAIDEAFGHEMPKGFAFHVGAKLVVPDTGSDAVDETLKDPGRELGDHPANSRIPNNREQKGHGHADRAHCDT